MHAQRCWTDALSSQLEGVPLLDSDTMGAGT
jgi:hypothetical protein